MPELTSVNAFVERRAVRDAYASEDHVGVDALAGDCSVGLHVGADADVTASTFVRAGSTPAFATLRVRGGQGTVQDVTVFLTADVLDQAVALRDALNRSIKFLRSKEARS